MIALPHGLGNQGTATGANHKANGSKDHEKRHDQIHRGKGGLAYKIGHEKTVHHAVDRGKDHHDHGGHGKADQFGIGKMLG